MENTISSKEKKKPIRKRKHSNEKSNDRKRLIQKVQSNTITNYFQKSTSGAFPNDTTTTSINQKSRVGFWSKYTNEISKKLLLPEKINYDNLNIEFWSNSLKRLGHNYWFTMQVQKPLMDKKISHQTKEFLWNEINECSQRKIIENEEKKK